MESDAVARVVDLFDGRGELDRLDHVEHSDVEACLARAVAGLQAAQVLIDAGLWETAYTTSYDAFRTAADAIVLHLGFRVRASAGGHRIATDIAHAALAAESKAFAPAGAERFRQGRHESEYFDPSRPIDKSEDDARWAIARAAAAIDAVQHALSAQ